MLEPNNRMVLTEALQPPPGYQLSYAVGTTFTVDLASALSVPLSFASRTVSESDEQIGILAALAEMPDRINIFAQAGQVSLGTNSRLVAQLEDMLHPVHVNSGLFHPKVWLLEYTNNEHKVYRLLNLSRNLTEDRSWDLAVQLEGRVADSTELAETCAKQNAPLATLLNMLPKLTVRSMKAERVRELNAFADRLSTVKWELPDRAKEIKFHLRTGVYKPNGASKLPLPDFSGTEALIISPFVSDGGLKLLRSEVRGTTRLISRAKSMEQLSQESLEGQLSTFVFDSAAHGNDEPEQQALAGIDPHRFSGLHAKAMFYSRAYKGHAFIGSANATDAGWLSNVELMLEIVGSQNVYGPRGLQSRWGNSSKSTKPKVMPKRARPRKQRTESNLDFGSLQARNSPCV